jgi:hypothetical protein
MRAPYHPYGGQGYGGQQYGYGGRQYGASPQQYGAQQGYGGQQYGTQQYSAQTLQQQYGGQPGGVTYTPTQMPVQRPLVTSPLPTPHETSANFSEDRGATPVARTGKFISKLFGGPPSTPQGGIDDQLLRTQRGLNQFYGYMMLKEDGIMGDNSRRVLIQFQHDTDLPQTGKADGATYDKVTHLVEQKRRGQAAYGADDGGDDDAVSRIHRRSKTSSTSSSSPSQPIDRSNPDWSTGLKESALFWASPPPLTLARLMRKDHVAEDAATHATTGTQAGGWYDAFTPPSFPWIPSSGYGFPYIEQPPPLFGNSGFGGYGHIGHGGPQGLGGYGSWGSHGGWGHGF